MGIKLTQYRLSDIVCFRNGAGIKQDFFTSDKRGVPLVKVSNFTIDSIDTSSEFTLVDVKHAENWQQHLLKENDILIATVGSWPPNWSSVVGKVVRVPQDASNTLQNQNTCCLIPSELVDNSYLFYALKNDDFLNWVVNIAQGSANQARIPIKKLGDYLISLPDLNEQRARAKILLDLDKKITLNRQINQTLEQMAQTLFKSWFVDFDPVIDNALDAGNAIPDPLQERAEQRHLLRAKADFKPLPAETRALFPSEFEETELGWVPKGWVYCRLVDIASISSGKRPPTKSDEKDGENFIPVWGGNGIKWFTNQYLFNNKYIITGRVGTLGTVYKVDGLSWPSDNALVINPHNKDCFEFIYQHLSNTDIESLNSGSTQPLVTQTALGNVDVLLPNGVDILSLFQCQTGMFDRKITENMLQIECLSSLRNELLPKLISGDLALDDLPEEIAEAAEAV